MLDISAIQIQYLDAGQDAVTKRDRLIRLTKNLSLGNVFEVERVEFVDHRDEHPGVMVFEIAFPIKVSDYRLIASQLKRGSMEYVRTNFNAPLKFTIVEGESS